MLVALLAQPPSGQLLLAVLLGLTLVAAASVLALAVSIRIARRMLALGDQRPTTDGGDREQGTGNRGQETREIGPRL